MCKSVFLHILFIRNVHTEQSLRTVIFYHLKNVYYLLYIYYYYYFESFMSIHLITQFVCLLDTEEYNNVRQNMGRITCC